jgi:hypothetical protein
MICDWHYERVPIQPPPHFAMKGFDVATRRRKRRLLWVNKQMMIDLRANATPENEITLCRNG